MKRIAALLLAVVLAVSFISPRAAATAQTAGTSPLNGFDDVDDSAWYSGAVDYVVSKGLMNGVSDTSFMPNEGLTRAMTVTVLSRMVDAKASGSPAFTDVAAGSWYADAVAWASETGIVTGYGDGTFKPDDLISRQDIVTILYRFAAKYFDAEAEAASLDAFADAGDVAEYAREAMAWAVGAGIISGYTSGGVSTLSPQNAASRAEFAQMVYHFSQTQAPSSVWTVTFTGEATVTVDGTVTDSVKVPDGETVTFTATAKSGFRITTVTAGGEILTAQDGVYTLTPTADTQVVIGTVAEPVPSGGGGTGGGGGGYIPQNYTVTFENVEGAVAYIGGQPAEEVTVASGSTVKFTVQVSEGVELLSVIANDVVLTPDGEGVYSVTVYSNTTVRFQLPTIYTVTFEGENATAYIDGVEITSVQAEARTRLSFTVEPDEGYELVAVMAGGEELTSAEGVYTLTVTGDITVEMAATSGTPTEDTYTVTLTGEHLKFYQDGQELAENKITIEKGQNYVTFNAMGQDGYHAVSGKCVEGTATVGNVGNMFMVSNVSSNCTVEVSVELNVYTVTFQYDYMAAYTLPDQHVTHGQLAEVPGEPYSSVLGHSRTGYHIGSWYTDEEMTQLFDFSTPIVSDMVLYGKWEQNVYTVTFDTDGGSEVPSQKVVHNNLVTKPEEVPTKEGFTFAGWYEDEERTKAFLFNSKRILADTTIYALWIGGEAQNIYLDGMNGDDNNAGTSSATGIKTWKRAMEMLDENPNFLNIHIVGRVTIPAGTEETWDLSEHPGVTLWRDPLTTGQMSISAVLVYGKLTLKNITFKGTPLDTPDSDIVGGAFIQVFTNGELVMDSDAVLTEHKTKYDTGAVIIQDGTFTMNEGSEISKINNIYSSSRGAVYVHQANKANTARFDMNGGTIKDIIFTFTSAYSLSNAACGVFVQAASGSTNAIANLNGGTIENCGGTDCKYVIQQYSSYPGQVNYNGTDIRDCNVTSGLLHLRGNSTITKGTFDAGDGAALYLDYTSSPAAAICPAEAGDITINGAIYSNNSATADAVLAIEKPLASIDGNYSFELKVPHVGAKILTAKSEKYTLTEEDLNKVIVPDDYKEFFKLMLQEDFDRQGNSILLTKSATPAAVVYLDGGKGDDNNDGSDKDHAVYTFERAKELLKEKAETVTTEGTLDIVVVGTVFICSGEDVVMSLEGIENARVVRGDNFTSNMFVVGSTTVAGFDIETNLTLRDITFDGNGAYMVANPSNVFRIQWGTVTMDKGAVIQNAGSDNFKTTTGGAFYVCGGTGTTSNPGPKAATLVMKDGSLITNCVAGTTGAAVVLQTVKAKFVMDGGEITNCHLTNASLASIKGVAVADVSAATMEFNGGKIHDNHAPASPYEVQISIGGGVPNTTYPPKYAISNDFELDGAILMLRGCSLTVSENFKDRKDVLQIYVGNTTPSVAPAEGAAVLTAEEGLTLTEEYLTKIQCMTEGYEFKLNDDGSAIVVVKTAS